MRKGPSQEVGIPSGAFSDICKRNPESNAKFRMLIDASNPLQLMIMDSREAIQLKLIRDALLDKTTPGQRLAIYKRLQEMTGKFPAKIKEEQGTDSEEIDELLKGPKLIPGKSRFHTSHSVETIEVSNPTSSPD